MAIRPTDLQLTYANQAQNLPLQQRAEEGPRTAQAAAQAAFVQQTERRNESIAATQDAQGNTINVDERQRDDEPPQGRKRKRQPGDPFEETVADASGLDDDRPHLIDFTA